MRLRRNRFAQTLGRRLAAGVRRARWWRDSHLRPGARGPCPERSSAGLIKSRAGLLGHLKSTIALRKSPCAQRLDTRPAGVQSRSNASAPAWSRTALVRRDSVSAPKALFAVALNLLQLNASDRKSVV